MPPYKPRSFPVIEGGEKTYLTSEFHRISTTTTAIEADITALEADITALEALPACFSAYGSGQSIADAVSTLVAFPNEVYDVGGHFNTGSSAWTPPAGKVAMHANCYAAGNSAAATFGIFDIYKNSSIYSRTAFSLVNAYGAQLYLEDIANGTDYYQVVLYMDVPSGTVDIADSVHARFMGHWISA